MINCAQYGNALSYYGNIQLAFYNPPLYTWGAWELPYPEHYQPPLDEEEIAVIEERRDYTLTPIVQENPESVILRMQHEVNMKAAQVPIRQHVKANKKPETDTDDEDYFILM